MEQELPIGLRFSLLHRSFRKRMDELLREKGLTGVQFGVLGALIGLEDRGVEEINQRDLERMTHVTHPTMTEILKRLEKKDFLRCQTSLRDRRFKCISSTARARELGREMAALEEDTFRWLCRGLSGEETAALLQAVDRMLENAREDCKKGDGCL